MVEKKAIPHRRDFLLVYNSNMFWADKLALELKERKLAQEWVDDMKTPSGRIHVGSLRGVVIHDLIHQALTDVGVKSKYTYVIEDQDPLDKLPHYLDEKTWSKHLGKPLFKIPSPQEGYSSYGEYFAKEFEAVFNKVGSYPEIIWGRNLYLSGRMNDVVKECLDKADLIRGIYNEMYSKKLGTDWYPFNAICSCCGKMVTTVVTNWNGKEITFECRKEGSYTSGCGNVETKTPFSDNEHFAGKLPWKVEWPAKWKVIGITVEGAGKDHMVKGGSHDFAKLMCERVLDYPVPYSFIYEFFLLKGKKMSSSKGRGSSAKEVAAVVPPSLLRLLMVRTKIKRPIDFDPAGMTIPDLYDEYDRCALAYYDKSDEYLARIFELSHVEKLGSKLPYYPRFRDVATYVQIPNLDLVGRFRELKGSKLTELELEILNERVEYARLWLKEYAPLKFVFAYQEEIPYEVTTLNKDQKEFLAQMVNKLSTNLNGEELQTLLYEVAKAGNGPVSKAFGAVYISLLGKSFGPRAGYLMLDIGIYKVKQRFAQVSRQ